MVGWHHWLNGHAAAAKLLQSCPTLCDPIEGSPPGSPIPGILQARTLEWVAISLHLQILILADFTSAVFSFHIYILFSTTILQTFSLLPSVSI